MVCNYFGERTRNLSREARSLIGIALSNKYYCPKCREIHIIEEEKVHEKA